MARALGEVAVELVARVRAQLRRGETGQAESLAIGDVQIDVPAHQVTRDGVQVALTPLEFDLLVALARKPRQVFTRELLLEQVWGYRHAADTRLVNVHVQRLRAKVERDPEKPEVVLTVVLALLAVASLITVVQRMLMVRRQALAAAP